MHKQKSIRILYVVHLFKYRGRKRVPIAIIKARQVANAVKLNGVVLGWANHRANRLVDLATLTFRFCEASAIAQGVGWSALHSFGCTATSCYAVTTGYKKRAQAKKHPHAKFK